MLIENPRKEQIVKDTFLSQYFLIVGIGEEKINEYSKKPYRDLTLRNLSNGNLTQSRSSSEIYSPSPLEERIIREFHDVQISAILHGSDKFPKASYKGWHHLSVVEEPTNNSWVELDVNLVSNILFDSDNYDYEGGEKGLQGKLQREAKQNAIRDLKKLAFMLGLNTISSPNETESWQPHFYPVGADLYMLEYGAVFKAVGFNR